MITIFSFKEICKSVINSDNVTFIDSTDMIRSMKSLDCVYNGKVVARLVVNENLDARVYLFNYGDEDSCCNTSFRFIFARKLKKCIKSEAEFDTYLNKLTCLFKDKWYANPKYVWKLIDYCTEDVFYQDLIQMVAKLYCKASKLNHNAKMDFEIYSKLNMGLSSEIAEEMRG